MKLKTRNFAVTLVLIVFTVFLLSSVSNNNRFTFTESALSQSAVPTITPTPTPDAVIVLNPKVELIEDFPIEMTFEQILNASLGSSDVDCDGVKNIADNCVLVFNPDQKNSDRDKYGDACDKKPKTTSKLEESPEDDPQYSYKVDLHCDMDKDGIFDRKDNCPGVCNRNQRDQNKNGIGDACEDKNGFEKICSNTTKANFRGLKYKSTITNYANQK